MNFDLPRVLRRLLPIIVIGIAGNIILTLYTSEENLFHSLFQFSPGYFSLAILFSLLPWLGHALRTVIWSRFLKHPVSFKDSFRIALAHDLGGAITPTVVGGTPLKFGLLLTKQVPVGAAGMIVLLQVLEDLVFLFTSLPLSILLAGGFDNPAVARLTDTISRYWVHLLWIVPSLVGIILLLRMVFNRNREKASRLIKGNWWQRFRVSLRNAWSDFISAGTVVLKSGKLRFLLTATMMYIEWSCRFFIPVVLVFALGIDADPFQLFFLHWMVWLTMLITPTPGATGGAEAVFYLLFIPFVPESLMGVLITGWRFVSYYLMMLIGAALLQALGLDDNRTDE